jgi:hypothetical protein
MKSNTILNLNAIVFVALGIAFALYSPIMLAFLSVPEMGIDNLAYWYVASFARMFGAALFGLGFVIWGVARAGEALPADSRNAVLRALLLGNLVAAFVAVTQQSSIWLTPIGWALTGVFIVFTLLYLYLILARQ